jgi:peptidoglycan/xylan/chitin deacetylase (PgdA/CDA1 family)
VSKTQLKKMKAQLFWLSKKWNFIGPEEFYLAITGRLIIKSDSLLVTLDDGFYSAYDVAQKVLDPLGIKAIFFVISDFIGIENKETSQNFIIKNILPDSLISDLEGDMRNMGWSELNDLIKNGHHIGGHTKTHARLANINEDDQLRSEILESANHLEKRLNFNIASFAYTFGDIKSFSPKAMKIAKQKFPYIFSGLRGNNFNTKFPLVILRDAISANEKNCLVGVFLYGLMDFRYKKSVKRLRSWA